MTTTTFLGQYNILLTHLNQSIEGYQQCSNESALTNFKEKFKLLENSRQNLLNKCKNLSLTILDAEETKQKPVAYFDMKSLIADINPDNIVVTIKRGESALLNAYTALLDCHDISPHIKFSLEKQFIVVQSELDYLNFSS